jgi:hypothetical protein
MSHAKLLFFFLFTIHLSENIYLHCQPDPDMPECNFSLSSLPDPEMDFYLSEALYDPEGFSDIWIFRFLPDTDPLHPKVNIEEAFQYERVNINDLFDNQVSLIHDLGHCSKWTIGTDDQLGFGLYGPMQLIKFVKEYAGMGPQDQFTSYKFRNVLVCENDVSRVKTPEILAQICPNQPVERYSFRDGPIADQNQGAVDGLEEAVVNQVPNTMGYLNIFYVRGCFQDNGAGPGHTNNGGIYLIRDPGNHSFIGKFLITHTQLDHHTLDFSPLGSIGIPLNPQITIPDAVGHMGWARLQRDPGQAGSPVVTNISFREIVAPAHQNLAIPNYISAPVVGLIRI